MFRDSPDVAEYRIPSLHHHRHQHTEMKSTRLAHSDLAALRNPDTIGLCATVDFESHQLLDNVLCYAKYNCEMHRLDEI